MALTSAQIVADALAVAKCPGFTSQGGRALNFVLDDLCLHRNLKVDLVTSFVSVPVFSNGPINLEADYLRTYEMSYVVQGETYFLDPCTLKQFDAEIQTPGIANYPYEYATDLSPVATGGVGLLYIYPQSGTPLTVTHRYYLKRAQIATPESSVVVPWFEDQDYLIEATAFRMMRITDDTRYDRWEQLCEKMILKHLLTEGDEQQVVKEVQLDPRRFKIKRGLKSTKQDPF